MASPITIEELPGAAFVSVIARKGIGHGQIAEAVAAGFRGEPTAASCLAYAWIAVGPGHWIVHVDAPPISLANVLRQRLAGLAAVTDLSDSYYSLRLAGAGARTLLQRGVAIDLHPESFKPGDAAMTVIAQISVLIHQLDDLPSYEVAAPRSYASSFRHWLDQTAATITPDA